MMVSESDDIEAIGQEVFKKKGAVSGASYQRESRIAKDRLC